MIPVQLPQDHRLPCPSLEMYNTDSGPHFSNGQCHTVHTSRITEIAQYSDIFQELDYFHIFILTDVCKSQISQYCLVLMIQLPPFLKSMQSIHWVLIFIKSKNTFQMGVSVSLFRNVLLGIVELLSHTW